MKKGKHIGIWMDHSVANLMEITNGSMVINSVKAELEDSEVQKPGRNEKHINDKEQPQLSGYYGKLKDILLNYEEVVLFGPASAKNDLLNILEVDHQFASIKIEVRQTHKMNDNEKIAFVRGYFINS